MPIRRLALAAAPIMGLLVSTVAVQAQDYLTREQLEAHMGEAVFCYYPSPRLSCAWAELYTELNEDHTVLQSANAVFPDPMSVLEFRIEWDGDALCVDEDTQGLLAMREAEGYRFPFDLEGLVLLPEDGLAAMVEEFRASSTGEACFRYSYDSEVEGQLLQHVFYDGVVLPDPDPVALIPLFAEGVAISPSG